MPSGGANGTGSAHGSAFDARQRRSLALLYIQLCAVPAEELRRTLAAAEILCPGLWELMTRSYTENFIDGWVVTKGHNGCEATPLRIHTIIPEPLAASRASLSLHARLLR